MSRYIDPVPQYLLNNGDLASDGYLYFFNNQDYLTPKNTYNANGIVNVNPIRLDGSGRVPEIYGDGLYSIRFESSSHVTQWAKDNVNLTSVTSLTNPTIGGDLVFTGLSQRIKGDFTNSTASNRVMIQSSVPNGQTFLAVIPNGTSTSSGFSACNSSDPNNASVIVLRADAASAGVNSTKSGTGTYLPLMFTTSAVDRAAFDISGNLHPLTDNAYSCGKTSLRFTSVWAANGTIQTSDERTKTEVLPSSLGLDFINALEPVSYKFIVGQNEVSAGDEIDEPIITPRAGDRRHWGLIAQQVKAVVDAAGVDFGGWILTDKNDPNSQQGLRYDQLICPLIKAVQELTARVKALEDA